MLRNDLLLFSLASNIDCKLLGTLLKKLMEARGRVEIVVVQLWLVVAIGWLTSWETDQRSLKFTDLKIKVVQQLSRFESMTKHPKLNPVAPPGVALSAFDIDDESTYNHSYTIAMQAIDDEQRQSPTARSCFNCYEVGHICPNCQHPIKTRNPLSPQPNRFAPRGRGAQLGHGGMGVAGGASGGMGVASGARGGMGVACGARGGMGVTGGASGGMGVAGGASNTYAMPFGQATGAALPAQHLATT
eukprot:1721916-Rhodomonas_salina.1